MDDKVIVKSKIRIEKTNLEAKDLVLDGKDLELVELKIDGQIISNYDIQDHKLTIADIPEKFIFECENIVYPDKNLSLEGLYKTDGLYSTQCEAEGFRRITYFLDRPDVMSTYTVKITANKAQLPILLSNGNKIETGDIDNGRHYVVWHDPFKKPCYLFALVAGQLCCTKDQFITCSDRKIDLEIYTHQKDLDKCTLAMQSLQKAMRWDEIEYNREYDLDLFMIVAVDSFNMGAMENKGLNIFNSSCILSDPRTATDKRSQFVEAVVAHEYFHNWTGNRITCRDWFQLSLKEGLTVFRDQEFSASNWSQDVCRIENAEHIQLHQFPEDQGVTSHPVQPKSYIDIDNFYTTTVYEKGAELIRMMMNIVGKQGFKKGMEVYFTKYDGQAVTIEELICSIEEANNIDLQQFRKWYHQAGTPVIQVQDNYDVKSQRYTIEFNQNKDFFIPIKMGLLVQNGNVINEETLHLTQNKQKFTFDNIPEHPTPSLLRDFSAPVKLHYDYSIEQLIFLAKHDNNKFNRWNTIQEYTSYIVSHNSDVQPLIDIYQHLISEISDQSDKEIYANMLAITSETYIGNYMNVFNVELVHKNRKELKLSLAKQLKPYWLDLYNSNSETKYYYDKDAVGKRALKNTALSYLATSKEHHNLLLEQFRTANNMTDEITALQLLVNHASEELANEAITTFYQKWQHDNNVLDSWFSVQARSDKANTLDCVKELLKHPRFSIENPNKVRSLIGSFVNYNHINFHTATGYQFLADMVIKLDDINQHIAARLCQPFTKYRSYTQDKKQAILKEVNRILYQGNLSNNCYEILSKIAKNDV